MFGFFSIVLEISRYDLIFEWKFEKLSQPLPVWNTSHAKSIGRMEWDVKKPIPTTLLMGLFNFNRNGEPIQLLWNDSTHQVARNWHLPDLSFSGNDTSQGRYCRYSISCEFLWNIHNNNINILNSNHFIDAKGKNPLPQYLWLPWRIIKWSIKQIHNILFLML